MHHPSRPTQASIASNVHHHTTAASSWHQQQGTPSISGCAADTQACPTIQRPYHAALQTCCQSSGCFSARVHQELTIRCLSMHLAVKHKFVLGNSTRS